MSQNIRKKLLFIGKEVLIVGAIFLLVFAVSKPINSWFGQRALDSTGLRYLSYAEANQLAEETGKPVMLSFSSLWCGNCRRMDAQVFANANVREKIESEYLIVRLDWDQDSDRRIFEKYGISGFPTILIKQPDTNTLSRLPTTFSPEQFLSFI